jgi:hypothetical protein
VKIDPFTARRLERFITDFRTESGRLPTLAHLEDAGFPKATVQSALKAGLIEEFYVTLTSGSVVKGYKLADPA